MHVAKPARHPARATAPAAPVLPEQQQAGRATLLPTCQPTLPSRPLPVPVLLSSRSSIPIAPVRTRRRRRRRRRPPPPNAVATAAPSANQPRSYARLTSSTTTTTNDDDDRKHPVYRAFNCIRLDPIYNTHYPIPNANYTIADLHNSTNGIPLFIPGIRPSITHTLDALNSWVQYLISNITHTTIYLPWSAHRRSPQCGRSLRLGAADAISHTTARFTTIPASLPWTSATSTSET